MEEWNEYGELKDRINESAAAKPTTPVPSTSNTPSKQPPATTEVNVPKETVKAEGDSITKSESTSPPNASATPTFTESNLTSALRQAGFEAAQKVTDAKSKARKEFLQASQTKSPQSGSSGATAEPAIKVTDGESVKEHGSGEDTAEEPAVLEGKGQAKAAKIPSAKEVEEKANQAMIEDESEHIHIAGSPSPSKRYKPSFEVEDDGSKRQDEGIDLVVGGAISHSESAPEEEKSTEPANKSTSQEPSKPTGESAKVSPLELTQPTTPSSKEPSDNKTDEVPSAATAPSKPEAHSSTKIPNPTSVGSSPTTGDAAKPAAGQGPEALLPLTSGPVPLQNIEPAAATTSIPVSSSSKIDDLADAPHPETKTQAQPAASGEHAAETVAD